jgi:hypothetical protein
MTVEEVGGRRDPAQDRAERASGDGPGQRLPPRPAEPAALWVADPNPRAQAFYRKHGFAADGTARSEDGVQEIRMARDARHGGTGRSHLIGG